MRTTSAPSESSDRCRTGPGHTGVVQASGLKQCPNWAPPRSEACSPPVRERPFRWPRAGASCSSLALLTHSMHRGPSEDIACGGGNETRASTLWLFERGPVLPPNPTAGRRASPVHNEPVRRHHPAFAPPPTSWSSPAIRPPGRGPGVTSLSALRALGSACASALSRRERSDRPGRLVRTRGDRGA